MISRAAEADRGFISVDNETWTHCGAGATFHSPLSAAASLLFVARYSRLFPHLDLSQNLDYAGA